MQLSNKMPTSRQLRERKLQLTDIRGIYLGTSTRNSAIHEIWINYETPTTEMQTVLANDINYKVTFDHMQETENAMNVALKVITDQAELDARIPSHYSNMVISVRKSTASKARKNKRVARPNVVTTQVQGTVFTDDLRSELVRTVDGHRQLQKEVELLQAARHETG